MRRGFTLIELLVVIAVIAIVAALVLSAVGRAKGAGQKAACINDLHQIDAAVLMYADDHADSIRTATNDYHIYFSYKDSIGPYLLRNGASPNDQQDMNTFGLGNNRRGREAAG